MYADIKSTIKWLKWFDEMIIGHKKTKYVEVKSHICLHTFQKYLWHTENSSFANHSLQLTPNEQMVYDGHVGRCKLVISISEQKCTFH